MKLKHIFYILLFLSPIVIGIGACNSGDKKEIALRDSIKQANLIDSVAVQKELNKYLIEPPDTNYTGDYLTKWENGNTKFKGFFRFGKRHGQWLAFYAEGTMWSECFYDKGLRHGANNVFYENGKPRYNGWFKNDLRDSLWVFFDESGAEARRVWFKNDEELPVSK
jgi:antitoxin component YwqK of YwqJK toxin-antitoxin module